MLTSLIKTLYRVFRPMFGAELVRMDFVQARQASQVVGVEAAMCVHLEASVVTPAVLDPNLRIVHRDGVAYGSEHVSSCTPLRWLCNAALLTNWWATQPRILLSVKATEVLCTDLLHACMTLQGLPPAAHDVHVMASLASPLDGRRDLCVIPREAVS